MPSQYINTLPVEILSKIFMVICSPPIHTLPSTFFRDWMKKLSRQSTSLRLVCTLWDTIAIRTPSIWKDIRFSVPPHVNYAALEPPPASVLSLWLDRSADVPLDVTLSLTNYPGMDLGELPEILSILFRSACRWKTLHIAVHGSAEHLLAHFPPFSNGLLESLTINKLNRFDVVDTATTDAVIDWVNTIPTLRSLEIIKFDSIIQRAMTLGLLHPALGNLAKLELKFDSGCWVEVWAACLRCTSVTSISLVEMTLREHETSSDANLHTSLPATTLSKLRTLKLYVTELENSTFLPLFSLHAPNLQTLAITTHALRSPDLSFAQNALQCISTFKCSLSLLKLSPINFDELEGLLMNPLITGIPLVAVRVLLQNHTWDEVEEKVIGWGNRIGKTMRISKHQGAYVAQAEVGWVDMSGLSPQVKDYVPDKGHPTAFKYIWRIELD